MLQLRDHRLERAALVVRLAEIMQAGMRFSLELVLERRDQARLADAGFAGQQDHAALAILDLLPSPQQKFDLLLAADHRRQARGAQRFETAGDGAFAQHPERGDGIGKALQLGRLDLLIGE